MTKKSKKVRIKKFFDLTQDGFFFIGGPCVIENEKMAYRIAGCLKKICAELDIPFIFKASYDKANRTSVKSYRGTGFRKGMKILSGIRKKYNIPVLTDVHNEKEAALAGKYVDVIQIPAFLSRQTDIIVAAAKTKKVINIKKGQFLSPKEVGSVTEKAVKAGNRDILITERGFTFGYNNLVVDLKSIASMKKTGYPVVIDAAHAVQKPGGGKGQSSGEREYIEAIASGAVAAGASGVFLEVHENPSKARSDRDTQVPLKSVKRLLKKLKAIFEVL